MLDASTSSAMATPRSVTYDPIRSKDGGNELGHAAIAAIGKDAPVLLAQRLEHRASVVNRIVAVAWATRGRCDDSQIGSPDEDLCIARPPVVLRLRGPRMIARWDERAIDDP